MDNTLSPMYALQNLGTFLVLRASREEDDHKLVTTTPTTIGTSEGGWHSTTEFCGGGGQKTIRSKPR